MGTFGKRDKKTVLERGPRNMLSKGLDLIDRGPEELWTEVRDIVQEATVQDPTVWDQTIPKEKKCKMVA